MKSNHGNPPTVTKHDDSIHKSASQSVKVNARHEIIDRRVDLTQEHSPQSAAETSVEPQSAEVPLIYRVDTTSLPPETADAVGQIAQEFVDTIQQGASPVDSSSYSRKWRQAVNLANDALFRRVGQEAFDQMQFSALDRPTPSP